MALVREVGELELDYGPPTVERESDGSSGECSLGDGRVENAAAAVLLEQAVGRLEGAAGADVLADHEHALVPLERAVERFPDRFEVRDRAHGAKTLCESASASG